MNANPGKSGNGRDEKQDNRQNGKQEGKQDDKPDRTGELRHPKPAEHNDDARSRMPDRGDKSRDQSPADRPGKKPGEGEPSVG